MAAITVSYDEIIAALSTIFGGGGILTLILKNKGFITFGRVTERRKYCIAHETMTETNKRTLSEVFEVKKTVNNLHEKVDALNLKMAEHIGYHSGRQTLRDNSSGEKKS